MNRFHSNSKLAATAGLVVSLVLATLPSVYPQVRSRNKLPPSKYHMTLNSSFVDRYDEILVIGDVHGCYDELRLLLEVTNTTGKHALKILLGDFMTRGPKSIEVLNYVKYSPSFLAVRGNHGDDVLRSYYETNLTEIFGDNDYVIEQLLVDHVRFISNLPYSISIPSLNALMVHAGFMPGVPLEENSPQVMTHIRNIKVDNVTGKMCPLGTADEGVPWASLWRGPQHVYFGHDHPRNLQLYHLATGIDTSAVYGEYLTAVFLKGPRKGKIEQLKSLGVYYTPPTEDPSKANGPPKKAKCLK